MRADALAPSRQKVFSSLFDPALSSFGHNQACLHDCAHTGTSASKRAGFILDFFFLQSSARTDGPGGAGHSVGDLRSFLYPLGFATKKKKKVRGLEEKWTTSRTNRRNIVLCTRDVDGHPKYWILQTKKSAHFIFLQWDQEFLMPPDEEDKIYLVILASKKQTR